MKIIIDSREQLPYDFSFYGIDSIVKKNNEGDYTIEGYEDKISIERKKSVAELSTNLGRGGKAFYKEMARLSVYPEKYILCEFSLEDVELFPEVGLPPKVDKTRVRLKGPEIITRLNNIENKYGVITIFCGDRNTAIQKCIEIFNQTINKYATIRHSPTK